MFLYKNVVTLVNKEIVGFLFFISFLEIISFKVFFLFVHVLLDTIKIRFSFIFNRLAY